LKYATIFKSNRFDLWLNAKTIKNESQNEQIDRNEFQTRKRFKKKREKERKEEENNCSSDFRSLSPNFWLIQNEKRNAERICVRCYRTVRTLASKMPRHFQPIMSGGGEGEGGQEEKEKGRWSLLKRTHSAVWKRVFMCRGISDIGTTRYLILEILYTF